MRKVLILVLFLFPLSAFAAETIPSQQNILLTALATIFISIAGYFGKLLGALIKRKINEIDNDTLQKTAYVAVRAVNDAFKETSGKDKFKIACGRVSGKLPKVDGEDVGMAVRAMYTNFMAEMPKSE